MTTTTSDLGPAEETTQPGVQVIVHKAQNHFGMVCYLAQITGKPFLLLENKLATYIYLM